MINNEKINHSYDVLKQAAWISKTYYRKPLIITYSGGKDSDVMLQLAIECLDKDDFEVLNSHTTVDAPETVYYIRDKFKHLNESGIKATILYPHYAKDYKNHKKGDYKSIFSLIVDRQMPPTRVARYCCKELKEQSTPNRIVCVGVREQESTGRKGRGDFSIKGKTKNDALHFDFNHVKEVFYESEDEKNKFNLSQNEESPMDCTFVSEAKKNNDLIVNPIYYWSDRDVWDFIHDRNMKYNPLYDNGFHRVGCIGCPFGGRKNMLFEFSKYPMFKKAYVNAFERMLKARIASGKNDITGREGYHVFRTGEDVFNWWIGEGSVAPKGQMTIEEWMDEA